MMWLNEAPQRLAMLLVPTPLLLRQRAAAIVAHLKGTDEVTVVLSRFRIQLHGLLERGDGFLDVTEFK
jgi:hypothetical protein